MTRYWLIKSEPDVFSLDDLSKSPNQTEKWDGVRNYQARNFIRDDMHVGDKVLFYHSNCSEPGIVGLADIAREAYPDSSALDTSSSYFDPKATMDNPRWFVVDVRFERHFPKQVSLSTIKNHPVLKEMLVAQRGQRLSVQPVAESHFNEVCALGGL